MHHGGNRARYASSLAEDLMSNATGVNMLGEPLLSAAAQRSTGDSRIIDAAAVCKKVKCTAINGQLEVVETFNGKTGFWPLKTSCNLDSLMAASKHWREPYKRTAQPL